LVTMAAPKKQKPGKKRESKAKKDSSYKGADKATRFKPGNNWWEARSTHGTNPIYTSPEQLLDACLQYFQWIIDNPLYEDRVFCHQGEITHAPVAKMRMATIQGLCIYAGISSATWYNYAKKPDFVEITKIVEDHIRTQRLEGSAADLLNPLIVSRIEGLAEKKELTGDINVSISSGDSECL
jgi:hypothetical protein